MKEVHIADFYDGMPRPHYLRGTATIEVREHEVEFKGTVVFPSNRDSIADRIRMPIPHVNVGDAYFGLWNAVYVIAQELKLESPLAKSGSYHCVSPIPCDTPLELSICISHLAEEDYDQHSEFSAAYLQEGSLLMRLAGNGNARKKQS